MKKIIPLILIQLLFMVLVMSASASGPATYTEEALKKINISIKKIGNFRPPIGASKEQSVAAVIGWQEKIFSGAGYSLQKSFIKYSDDLKKDSDFVSKGVYMQTPLLLIGSLADQFNEMRKEENLKKVIDKTFSKETVKALDNIMAINNQYEARRIDEQNKAQAERDRQIALEKRNNEELSLEQEQKEEQQKEKMAQEAEAARLKKIELANKEEQEQKQQLVQQLGGHYELASEEKGTLDIKVISNDKAMFSFVNKLGSGNKCQMDNKDGEIQYINDDRLLIVYDNGNCELTLNYKIFEMKKKTRHTIDITKKGCDAFCEEGGITTGQYKREISM